MAWHCTRCGNALPNAGRWCKACGAPISSSRWESEPLPPGAVIQTKPPRVTTKGAPPSVPPTSAASPAALHGRPLRPNPSMREPIIFLERSRWRGGSTTFGPVGRIVASIIVVGFFTVLATSSILGLAFSPIYVMAAIYLLREIWSRDEIDDRPKATVMDGVREALHPEKYAKPVVAEPSWVCPRCHAELEKGSRWCGVCKAGVSNAEFVTPAAYDQAVLEVRPPRPVIGRARGRFRLGTTGWKIILTVAAITPILFVARPWSSFLLVIVGAGLVAMWFAWKSDD